MPSKPYLKLNFPLLTLVSVEWLFPEKVVCFPAFVVPFPGLVDFVLKSLTFSKFFLHKFIELWKNCLILDKILPLGNTKKNKFSLVFRSLMRTFVPSLGTYSAAPRQLKQASLHSACTSIVRLNRIVTNWYIGKRIKVDVKRVRS